MNVNVDLDKLQDFNPTLYRVVCGRFNLAHGVHSINLDDLRDETRRMLQGFFVAQLREAAAQQPDAFAIDPNEAANRRRLADEEAGVRRMQQYVDEQGLLPIDENAIVVRKWLDANLNGYLSAAGVDAAVSHLGPKGTKVLHWKSPAARATPTTAAPESDIVLLPNGEPELPLDSSESVMRRASVTQLRDLSKRRQEGRTRQGGWTGASFK